ncbi:MAG: hypothetical protein ACFFBD_28505 [Candidatus Hodarchaeota archaeon]
MSQAFGAEKIYDYSSQDQIALRKKVKHIEIVLSVFALHSGYLSEKEALMKTQKIVQEYTLQGRSFPLSTTGFKRQISLAIRKNWLERNGMLLRITSQGQKAFYGL